MVHVRQLTVKPRPATYFSPKMLSDEGGALRFFIIHPARPAPTAPRSRGIRGKVLYSVVWICNETNCKLIAQPPPFHMNNLTKSVERLNLLIVKFKFFEALDEFYDDSIVSCENEGNPTIGLENYRLAAKKYLDNISNNSASLKNVIVSDSMSFASGIINLIIRSGDIGTKYSCGYSVGRMERLCTNDIIITNRFQAHKDKSPDATSIHLLKLFITTHSHNLRHKSAKYFNKVFLIRHHLMNVLIGHGCFIKT